MKIVATVGGCLLEMIGNIISIGGNGGTVLDASLVPYTVVANRRSKGLRSGFWVNKSALVSQHERRILSFSLSDVLSDTVGGARSSQ